MSLKNFNKAIFKIEKDDISVVEVDLSLSELRVSLAARKETRPREVGANIVIQTFIIT